MTKIRDYIQAESLDSFEKHPRRKRKNPAADQRFLESQVASLTESNEKLSQQNLILQKLWKYAYRILPPRSKEQVDKFRSELGQAAFTEVHPE